MYTLVKNNKPILLCNDLKTAYTRLDSLKTMGLRMGAKVHYAGKIGDGELMIGEDSYKMVMGA